MGALGLAFLALYFAGGWLAGLSGAFELLLFFLGVALLLVEAFLFPGFGIAGALGVGAILRLRLLHLRGGKRPPGDGHRRDRPGAWASPGVPLPAQDPPARALVLESAIEAHATGEEVEVGMVGTAPHGPEAGGRGPGLGPGGWTW
jgi:membrane-bound serine protease (ClpP class)